MVLVCLFYFRDCIIGNFLDSSCPESCQSDNSVTSQSRQQRTENTQDIISGTQLCLSASISGAINNININNIPHDQTTLPHTALQHIVSLNQNSAINKIRLNTALRNVLLIYLALVRLEMALWLSFIFWKFVIGHIGRERAWNIQPWDNQQPVPLIITARANKDLCPATQLFVICSFA